MRCSVYMETWAVAISCSFYTLSVRKRSKRWLTCWLTYWLTCSQSSLDKSGRCCSHKLRLTRIFCNNFQMQMQMQDSACCSGLAERQDKNKRQSTLHGLREWPSTKGSCSNKQHPVALGAPLPLPPSTRHATHLARNSLLCSRWGINPPGDTWIKIRTSTSQSMTGFANQSASFFYCVHSHRLCWPRHFFSFDLRDANKTE